MTTLQEQFEKDFPDKSVKEINANVKYENNSFTNYDLDLRDYVKLEVLYSSSNKLTSIDLTNQKELMMVDLRYNELISIDLPNQGVLEDLDLKSNKLTSIDFLNTLPNPDKLEGLEIYNNNIQPTDIVFFSKFINLDDLKIGTIREGLEKGKHNQFYGSLKSYQNLTKLEAICIEATDVNDGLEYLPVSLAQSTAQESKKDSKRGGYVKIECSPNGTNAKCKAVQDQLRPFNYDLEAWQLAHPEKMLISRPEYFTNPNSKDKWLTALNNKILEVRREIITAKEQEADKTKKIVRLETKISELEKVKETISQQTQTEFSTQDKSTQTDLTMEQIKRLEEENNKSLCQKIFDKIIKK